jgi:hypothetical protein
LWFEGKALEAERQPADANAPLSGKNITVRNNLIVGMRSGLFGDVRIKNKGLKLPWIPTDHCQFENVLVENNTVVSSGVQPYHAPINRLLCGLIICKVIS